MSAERSEVLKTPFVKNAAKFVVILALAGIAIGTINIYLAMA